MLYETISRRASVIALAALGFSLLACGSDGSSKTAPPSSGDTAATATSATGSASARPAAMPGTPGVASGAIISVDSVVDASGDFSVNVNVSGVTQPYVAFNISVAFDPSILSVVAIKPGPALAPEVGQQLCAQLPAVAGAVGLGCTAFDAGTASTNGVLATITFRRLGAGTTRLHLRSLAEGGATSGTFIVTPQGAVRKPDIVTLNDGSVTTS